MKKAALCLGLALPARRRIRRRFRRRPARVPRRARRRATPRSRVDLGIRRSRLPGDEELRAAAAGTDERRLQGRGRRRRHADGVRRDAWQRQAGDRHPRRVRRAAGHHAGRRAPTASRSRASSPATPAGITCSARRRSAAGHRGRRTGSTKSGTPGHDPRLRHARRGRRRGQGLHGARRAVQRRGRGAALASGRRERRRRRPARSPTSPAKFRFHGMSAHASGAPENGRSALDGVEAMNHMANLMREHMPADTRIHYVITSGGSAPNVVPDFAEVYYYVRHIDSEEGRVHLRPPGQGVRGRGARHRHDRGPRGHPRHLRAAPERHARARDEQEAERVGGFTYTPEEQAFAEKICADAERRPVELGSDENVQAFDFERRAARPMSAT